MECHCDEEGTVLTCEFGEYHSLNNSRQETAVNVFLVFSALLLIAIEQQGLKPEHVLKIRVVVLHTKDTMSSTTVIKPTYTFIACEDIT